MQVATSSLLLGRIAFFENLCIFFLLSLDQQKTTTPQFGAIVWGVLQATSNTDCSRIYEIWFFTELPETAWNSASSTKTTRSARYVHSGTVFFKNWSAFLYTYVSIFKESFYATTIFALLKKTLC